MHRLKDRQLELNNKARVQVRMEVSADEKYNFTKGLPQERKN